MAITVLKTKFEKVKPKEIHYRCYKNFVETDFRNDLKKHLTPCSTYEMFEKVFLEVLQTHAPLKKKYVRANEVPYMTKTLRKAIMKRSQLESKFYKTKVISDEQAYKKHKNFVSRLYKKERKTFYKNLNIKDILDNKKFWKNIKPLFSNKGTTVQKITLVKEKEIISEDSEVDIEYIF